MRLIDADVLKARIMIDAPSLDMQGSAITKAFILAMIDSKSITPTVAEWVKCEDGMPEEHETMFAKLKGTNKWTSAMFERMSDCVFVVAVYEDGTRKVKQSFTVDGKWDIEKRPIKVVVTHWMPNPELPAN